MQIRLTEDIERGLIEKANQLGKLPETLALEVLRKQFAHSAEVEASVTQARTLADLLGDYIGTVDSSEYVEGGAQMSKDTGKKFAEGMLKKREEKRL
ncbi:hypothetical protein HYR99_12580 [Candidatus Poribacteria bacterium]|nr:hypothetical protein [Candidatus Poribacteria bacterium]